MDLVSYLSCGDDHCEKPRNKKRRVEEGEKERVEIPCATDWLYAKAFVKFLKKFYEATLRFSCYQKVTANAPFKEMFKIVEDLKSTMRNGDPFMKKVASSMKLKFDKYRGSIKDVNQVMLVAVALDPRYKLDYINYGLEFLVEDSWKADELTQGVKNLLILLYGAYKNENPNQPHAYSEVSYENGGVGNEEGSDPLLDGFMKRRKEKDVVHITNEVDKYLAEASENPKNLAFDLLKWWKENSSRFPVLSKVVRDVFVVSVSSVASKAACSAGKRVVDPFRACLTPKTVEALICTNDWLKAEAFDFFKELIEDEIDFYNSLEKMEKEIEILQLAEDITTTSSANPII